MADLPPLPPPADADVREPIKRHLISAGAVVVAAALLFAVVGIFQSPSDDGEPEAMPTTEISVSPGSGSVPSTSVTAVPTATATPSGTPSATPTPAPDPTPTARSTPTPTPTPTPEPEPTPTPSDGRIAPSSISIQVLDAVLDDGRRTADRVAKELKSDGYRVVATNSAIRTYQKTTVMFTAGFEAQARQIADEYGYTEVQQKPDNLTDGVQVHLVVGLDAR